MKLRPKGSRSSIYLHSSICIKFESSAVLYASNLVFMSPFVISFVSKAKYKDFFSRSRSKSLFSAHSIADKIGITAVFINVSQFQSIGTPKISRIELLIDSLLSLSCISVEVLLASLKSKLSLRTITLFSVLQ